MCMECLYCACGAVQIEEAEIEEAAAKKKAGSKSQASLAAAAEEVCGGTVAQTAEVMLALGWL